MSFKIGIVGLGYVGGAILNAYTLKNRTVHTFDVNPATNPSCKSLQELVELVDLIYVAVPTPMKSTGECDTSIVESVVNDIGKHKTPKIIVIKSTVPPKTTDRLQDNNLSHTIMFNPEFLTEANYKSDYLHQDVMLLGFCGWVWRDIAYDVLQEIKSTVNSVKYSATVNATDAEFYKYLCNTFLATKVSFANEMESIASKLNVNWNTMKDAITVDSRMGKSHWNVPGPDGHAGFGGTCFPKDISAIRHVANTLDIPTPVLDSVWNRNITIDRPEKDWEQLKGRAIS
jgi:nucleotide sugar dehydrogenase